MTRTLARAVRLASGAAAVTVDLTGRTTFAELAAVLAGARCVVSGNTGPMHLAAAVRTPVVCLFAPVVPAPAWGPWSVPMVLLGDQEAPCAGTRARTCPVPGHPCLSTVTGHDVVQAVAALDAVAGIGDLAGPTSQLATTHATTGALR